MEQVDDDDDFGDLYGDLQIPAISAHLYNTQATHSPFNKIAGPSCQILAHSGNVFQDQKVSIEDSDTSDDDLKIVLNNDDCNVLAPVTSVNGGLDADEENGDFDGHDNAGELQRTNNWSNQDERVLSLNSANTGYLPGHLHYKYSSLQRMGSKANGEDCLMERSASEVAQNCSAFSLPRYRSILDVNVCTFEHKPWTLPGADVSNYFNFGFDEKGWKHYCNQLDNLRRLKSTFSNHCSMLKAFDVGASEHGEETNEVSSAFLNESQGRVIQVGYSAGDRQPSIDTKWSTDRDSEAIQIVLKDFIEDYPGKTVLMEKDDSLPKVSKNVDYVMDDEKITCSVNERSRDSLDCLVLKSSSTTPGDMDVLGSKQHTDVDWHHDEYPNLYNSQGKTETSQISDDSMDKYDKDSCKTTVLSMEGIESMLQEPSLSSPSLSSSGIHCALSNDTVNNKKVKSCLQKEKSVYHEYYDRKRSRRSPVSRNLEHYNSKEYDRSSERKIDNTRRDTRVYRPDCYDREDAIHHKRYDHFNSNNEKAFDWQKNHLASSRSSCWKVQQDIRNDEELHFLGRWNDDQYLPRKNLSNYKEGFIRNPLKRKEYRKLSPQNDSPYIDMESSLWRKNGDRFQFRKATEEDERYGFYDKETKFYDDKYESPYMSYSDNRSISLSPHPYTGDWLSLPDSYNRQIGVDRNRESVQYRHSEDDRYNRQIEIDRSRESVQYRHSEDDRYNRQIEIDRSRESVQYRHSDDDFPGEGRFNYPNIDYQNPKALFSVGRKWKSVNDRVNIDSQNLQALSTVVREWKLVNDRVAGRQDKLKQEHGEGNTGYHLQRNLITCYRGDDDGETKFSCRKKAATTENDSDVEEGQIVLTEEGEEEREPIIMINQQRIIEMRAKMEKRRERFMEGVLVSKKNVKVAVSRGADDAESGDANKQERPVRKRRWGGGTISGTFSNLPK